MITWRCHVCGDDRPDDKIDVFKAHGTLAGRVDVQYNVRHCNDRPECIARAADVAATWQGKMT